MSKEFLTLQDVAARSGSDQAVGLLEEGVKMAPEIGRIMGRPIKGTSYKARIRTARPTAGFRGANQPIAISAGAYGSKLVECFILDAQMSCDAAVAEADEFGRDAFLTDEAIESYQAKLRALATALYYGEHDDADGTTGFDGLGTLIPQAMMVNAGGDTANACTSVYALWNNPKGVHFVWGGEGRMVSQDEWVEQLVQTVENGVTKQIRRFLNGIESWVGLQVGPESAGRIANLDFDHKLTDKLIAELVRKFPVGKKPDLLLMNRTSAFQLQESRSATTIQAGKLTATSDGIWAPDPVSSNGVPILVTDMIVDTEGVVTFS